LRGKRARELLHASVPPRTQCLIPPRRHAPTRPSSSGRGPDLDPMVRDCSRQKVARHCCYRARPSWRAVGRATSEGADGRKGRAIILG
jgi:hypothetical protein